MINRIDLFMPPNVSQYGVLHHFTKKFHEALLRLGVKSRILEAEYNNPKPFLTELFKDVPDCTLSFNGLLPDDEGRFFCDLVRIPHVACVVDSPNGFVSLINSPLTVITAVDLNACDFFRGIQGKNVLFMPHGVEKNIHVEKNQERPFDVVLLSSCIDIDAIKEGWKNKFSPALCQALEEASTFYLADTKLPYVNAFVNALDKQIAEKKVDPASINFIDILDELEIYIRGKARLDLVRSIKDARIDIFGAPASTTTWKKQTQGQSNIVVHDGVPYDQALEIMQKSKIILNSCAWIKNGTHERTLAAAASGALPFTEGNEYMGQFFKDGENIAFYQYNALNNINDKINLYLKDETLRNKVAAACREEVMHHHTWDHRASLLIKELDPIIRQLKKTQ
jgi:spore maturation protein CgeB